MRRDSRMRPSAAAAALLALLPRARAVSMGAPADVGQFPWLVTLHWSGSQNGVKTFCGGVLVSPQWALTAAHCVRGGSGAHGYVQLPLAPGAPQLNVVEVHSHPAWVALGEHDIAVLKLEHAAWAPPARLACAPSAWGMLPANAMLTVAGAGLNETNLLSARVASARVPAVGGSCTYPSVPLLKSQVLRDACAGTCCSRALHPTACPGDSGGPLFDDAGTVYGLVSRGDASHGCGRAIAPDVYTFLAQNCAFVRDTIHAGGGELV